MRFCRPAFISFILLAASSCRYQVSRETGRAILVENEKEDEGYGLYSYVLFGSPPTDATRDRYLQVAKVWRDQLPNIGEFTKHNVPRLRLNITYFLAAKPAPAALEPQWLVDNYDYARARIFLDTLPRDGRHNGPYIISVLKPLSGIDHVDGDFLSQDLSSVPPSLIAPWIREFVAQSAQDRFWERRTMADMVLRLRTNIEIAAIALPDVKKGASEWRSVLGSLIVHQAQ